MNLTSNSVQISTIIELLLSKKRFIILVTILFVVLGVIVAFTTPAEWRTGNTLVTINESNAPGISSSLGSLAGIAGINLGTSGSGQINALAYQDILTSTFFIYELSNKKFYSGNLNDSTTLYEYQKNHMKSSLISKVLSLPSSILGLFKGSSSGGTATVLDESEENYFYLSLEDNVIYNDIATRFSIQFDKTKETLNISFKYQDSYLAAQAIQFASLYLDEYIENFEFEEQNKKYTFIKEQIELKRASFEAAQQVLISFQDSNLNLTTNQARSREKDLQDKRDLEFNLYSSLLQSLQEIEIDLASKSTNLKALGKTQIPVKKASMSKKIILIMYFILGFFLAASYLILRELILVPLSQQEKTA